MIAMGRALFQAKEVVERHSFCGDEQTRRVEDEDYYMCYCLSKYDLGLYFPNFPLIEIILTIYKMR